MTDFFSYKIYTFVAEGDSKNYQELLSKDYIILLEISERQLK